MDGTGDKIANHKSRIGQSLVRIAFQQVILFQVCISASNNNRAERFVNPLSSSAFTHLSSCVREDEFVVEPRTDFHACISW